MDKIDETLQKISKDTVKARKIGKGEEEVILFMMPRFDLSASNVRNFMSGSFDRLVEKKLIRDGIF